MALKPWIPQRLAASVHARRGGAANVVTMIGLLYVAFGTPKVYVRDGYVVVYVRNQIDVRDRTPARVQIVP